MKPVGKAPTVQVLLSALQPDIQTSMNAVVNLRLNLFHLGHSCWRPSRRKDSPACPGDAPSRRSCVLLLLLRPPADIVPALHVCRASGKTLPGCAPFVRRSINSFNHDTVMIEEPKLRQIAFCGVRCAFKGLLQSCLLCTVPCVSRPSCQWPLRNQGSTYLSNARKKEMWIILTNHCTWLDILPAAAGDTRHASSARIVIDAGNMINQIERLQNLSNHPYSVK